MLGFVYGSEKLLAWERGGRKVGDGEEVRVKMGSFKNDGENVERWGVEVVK